ncbi:MAG: hypothetical protein ICV73_30970 [Acetobacteraceae bacterium]|nr:hypothetical protein [Acetobacteraceae bacterium]
MLPVIHTLVPGPLSKAGQISLVAFRRKRGASGVPYAFLVLEYGGEAFQVFLPSPERDRPIEGRFPAFPHPRDKATSAFGPTLKEPLDLMSCVPVKGEVVTVTMSLGERQRIIAPANGGGATSANGFS